MEKKRKDETIKVTAIENTPFSIVELDEKAFIALGNQRVSEEYEKTEDAKKWFDENLWDLIIKLVFTIVNKIIESNKDKEKINSK